MIGSSIYYKTEHKSELVLATDTLCLASPANYGESIVRVLQKIDRVITVPHCILSTVNPYNITGVVATSPAVWETEYPDNPYPGDICGPSTVHDPPLGPHQSSMPLQPMCTANPIRGAQLVCYKYAWNEFNLPAHWKGEEGGTSERCSQKYNAQTVPRHNCKVGEEKFITHTQPLTHIHTHILYVYVRAIQLKF